jgi:beta-1,4-mannosyl-glycoprotein beta-1,4-N-acetylglucosaminyltransferase
MKTLCEYHNWTLRPTNRRPMIIDAVIFSVELDLLEIRLRELWSVVDRFIVLEADRTFTGKPKKLILKENKERFIWAKDKLHIDSFSGLSQLSAGESPFKNENEMRKHMNTIISSYAKNGDIVICSDVDEIPSMSTVALLKNCDGFPDNMHLQLKTYVYSFEYYFSIDDSWRAHVNIYNKSDFNYRHGRLSSDIIGNAGKMLSI